MYFENHNINEVYWAAWTSWANDIVQKNSYLALDFVREFCMAYKKQSDELYTEYLKIKNDLQKAHVDKIAVIDNDYRAAFASAEQERITVQNAVKSENNQVETVLSRVKQLESDNFEAKQNSEYVELQRKRNANLTAFREFQDRRVAIAVRICEIKTEDAKRLKDSRQQEEDRQYREKTDTITNDYQNACNRIEMQYRELFNRIMSKNVYDEFIKKVESCHYPLEGYQCRKLNPEYIYIGVLSVNVDKQYKTALSKELIESVFGPQSGGIDDPYVIKMPYCQKVKDGIGMFIMDDEKGGNADVLKRENKNATFEDELPMLMLRTFMSFPAGQVESFTIDVGRMGTVFHPLLVLADGEAHKRIIDNAASQTIDIESKLATLRSKMDSLANNYGSEYDCRMKREPYYILGISDFPKGFSNKALTDLSAIVKNAAACGVAVFILAKEESVKTLRDADKVIVEEIMKTLHYVSGTDNIMTCKDSFVTNVVHTSIESIYDFEEKIFDQTMQTLVTGIREYRPVRTTIQDIYPDIDDLNTWLTKDTMNGIRIPVGIRGSSDIINVLLGMDGTNSEHHILMEGGSGKGKSSFLHAMIMSALISYSQKELEIYLVDFKEGVEFIFYAHHDIPSLKVVTVQSEREFGLQVFKKLEEKMHERDRLFKDAEVTKTSDYRRKTNKPMPKIMLIIDEFQVLFSVQDEITSECEKILRTLVDQGRAFGIHIVMATQNIEHAKLDSKIYEQMSVRIAFKEANNVFQSDNDGVMQLVNSRDGSTLYNRNGGKRGYNVLFYTLFLGDTNMHEMLETASKLQKSLSSGDEGSDSKILYTSIQDNKRHVLNQFVYGGANPTPLNAEKEQVYGLYIGEAYDLSENLKAGLVKHQKSNVFVSVSPEQLPKIMISSVVSVLYGDLACKNATRGNRLVHFVNMTSNQILDEGMKKIERLFPQSVKYAYPENCDNDYDVTASGYEMVEEVINNTYSELTKRRMEVTSNTDDRIVLFLAGMEKAGALADMNAYENNHAPGFMMGAMAEREKNIIAKLLEIIKDGPECGINCIMSTSNIDSAIRLFGDRFYDEFALRICQNMPDNYMQDLTGETFTDGLRKNTLIFANKTRGIHKKFRAYEIPGDEWLTAYSKRYREVEGGISNG